MNNNLAVSLFVKILPVCYKKHPYHSYVFLWLASFFFLLLRRQQICSPCKIREKSGHVRSLATVQNQTWICTQSKLRPSQVWPRIWQSESTLAFSQIPRPFASVSRSESLCLCPLVCSKVGIFAGRAMADQACQGLCYQRET